MPDKFIYAMKERIGNPDLFTGRKRELATHLDWVQKNKEGRSKSIAILLSARSIMADRGDLIREKPGRKTHEKKAARYLKLEFSNN